MSRVITPPRILPRPSGFLLGISAGLALALSLASSRGVSAQEDPDPAVRASLGGQVVDARTEEPLAGATVIVAIVTGAGSEEARDVTDPEGRFLFRELVPGEHTIRIHVDGRTAGPLTIRLREDQHTEIRASVALDGASSVAGVPLAELPPLEVEIEGEARPGKLRGFYERRELALGYFISGREIRERSPFRSSDLLREVPGLIVTRDPGGRHGVRVGRSGRCPVDFYVDGAPAPGLSIDDIPPGDIDGVEIYRGPSEVPIQYRRANTCAAILIWTREPGRS